MRLKWPWLGLLVVVGCDADKVEIPVAACGRRAEVLCPVVEPLADAPPQPRREHPTAVALDLAGATAYVALTGSEAEPGSVVAAIDVAAGTVRTRIQVGPHPVALALHPGGRWLVVAQSYARTLTVIDTTRDVVVGRARVSFYLEDLAFDPAGRFLVASDRQHDGVWQLPVTEAADGLTIAATEGGRFVPIGSNPGALDLCPDGRTLLIAVTGELGIARLDLETDTLTFVDLNAPPNDVRCLGRAALVATLGEGSGHPQEGSPECVALRAVQGDNVRCDATAAVRFADIQNDLVVLETSTLKVLQRFTSDTAEASHVDAVGAIEPARMVVAGSFPRALAVGGQTVYLSFSASGEVQTFTLPGEPATWDGAGLSAGPTFATGGLAAHGLAVTPAGTVVVANRLSDDVSLMAPGGGTRRVSLGSGERFPATDEEVGELFFFTSYFSADGDGSCGHCHPNGLTDGKAWSVATVPPGHSRQVPQARNLGRTLPLLLEGTQDANGFNLEMEDLAPRVDFDADPANTYARGAAARDVFFGQTSQQVFGRAVGFEEMVGKVGAFLVHEPRLLPNPFPDDSPEAVRGQVIFRSLQAACDACHPVEGGFTTNEQFAQVIATRPGDEPNPQIPAEIARDFGAATAGVFDTPSLRGLWDRPARFLHDGRARTVAETFLPPGHAALGQGETGFNFGGRFATGERIFDSHGGGSHLTPAEVADLLAYLRTIE